MKSSRLLSLLLFAFSILFLAPEAQAQKNGSNYREFPAYGFEFKPLKDFLDVPSDAQKKAAGVIGTLKAERGPQIKTENNERFEFNPSCSVIQVIPKAATTDGDSSGGGLRGRAKTEEGEDAAGKEYVQMLFGAALRREEFKLVKPEISEFKAKNIVGKREIIQTFVVYNVGALDMIFDVYTFQMPDYKIVFVWDYPADKKLANNWKKAVEKSMKTFRTNVEDIEISSVRNVDSESNYEDLIEFHGTEVEQTPGWRLVEVPTKQYLIKTNSDDQKTVNEVIKRLEASRRLFEADFPPTTPITSISIVRLCGTQDDFKAYGGVGDNVGGYFSPSSEELVLFFGESGKEETMGVMTHESFHQYSHFLFNRSKAHRWFDEGHGDYYGAWKMKGKELAPNKDMKGGYARTPIIKRMVREESVPPLKKHIRMEHSTWQSGGVESYAQSFSIIYFLREGARGKVKNKYWQDEYVDIIPNYMTSLNDGYQEAYQEIVDGAQKQLEIMQAAGAEFEELESARQRIKRPWDFLNIDLPNRQLELRAKAMEDSWGKIDELEFEDLWLQYVDDEM